MMWIEGVSRLTQTAPAEPVAKPRSITAHADGLLRGVARAVAALLQPTPLTARIEHALAQLGPEARTDRAFATQFDAARGVDAYLAEWVRPGFPSGEGIYSVYPATVAELPDLFQRLFSGEALTFSASQSDRPLPEINRSLGTKSDVIVPILVEGRYWGSLVFDDCTDDRPWEASEIDVLRVLASAVAQAVLRDQETQARLDAERERAEDNERLLTQLKAITAGSRQLVDAVDFESSVRDWLGTMGRAAGAARASFYQTIIHPACGLPSLSCTTESVRDGVGGSYAISFEEPCVIDPRGAERVMGAAATGTELVALHTDETEQPMHGFLAQQQNATVLLIPIHVDGRTTHALSLDFLTRRDPDEREGAVLQTAADTMASVLKRREAEAARLDAERAAAEALRAVNAELARRRDLLDAVVAISAELLGATHLAEKAQQVVQQVITALRADRCMIGVMLPPDAAAAHGYVRMDWEAVAKGVPRQTDNPTLKTMALDPYPEFRRSLLANLPLQVTTEEITSETGHAEQEATGSRSQFQYPIFVDGTLWGVIGADDCQTARRWDEAEINTLRLVASAIGSLVSRERLLARQIETERRIAADNLALAELRESIVTATSDLIEAESFEAGLSHWLETLARRMGAARASAFDSLPDENGEPAARRFLAEWAIPGLRPSARSRLPADQKASRKSWIFPLVLNGRPLVIDAATAPPGQQEWLRAQDTETLVVVPFRQRATLWCVAFDFAQRQSFAPRLLEVLQTATAALAAESERRSADAARHRAERDLAEERARMARDIHDTLAQGFAGVIMQLRGARYALAVGDRPAADAHATSALEVARLGLSEARRSVFALRPPMGENGDVLGALRTLLERTTEGLVSEARLDVEGAEQELPLSVAPELHRIAQEALSNALRHAGARRIVVRVAFGPREVLLDIVDDGRGFDPAQAMTGGGFGLVSMQERAARLGADFSIISAPAQGTRVSLRVPLPDIWERAPS
jgi:signal transduction histidine kinase